MTTQDERRRAIGQARRFLTDLLDAKATPLVPRPIRRRAYDCLRHYPTDADMQDLTAAFGDGEPKT